MAQHFLRFAIAFCGIGAMAVWGAPIDTLIIMPNGANSMFTITGTLPGDFSALSYGAPNTPYTLMFTVPTSPTVFSFVDSGLGVFVLDAAVKLNGIVYSNSQVAFFTPDLGGGVDVCVNDICSPDPPTNGPVFAAFTIPVQLFTGTPDHPTLISGPVTIDSTQSFVESPVPEPSSVALVLAACSALAFSACRRRRGVAAVTKWWTRTRTLPRP